FSPFISPASAPALRVTIGDEGPLTVQFAVPTDRADARAKLETAIRAASTTPGFANALVFSRNNQFFVVSGDGGRGLVQNAPGDPTADDWKLTAPAARESFGLLSGPITAPIALSNPAPSLDAVMGTSNGRIGPRKVDLTGLPTTLAAARKPLEDA